MLASHTRGLPTIPLKKQVDGYKVGPTWKLDERPEDNRSQARIAAEKACKVARASRTARTARGCPFESTLG